MNVWSRLWHFVRHPTHLVMVISTVDRRLTNLCLTCLSAEIEKNSQAVTPECGE